MNFFFNRNLKNLLLEGNTIESLPLELGKNKVYALCGLDRASNKIVHSISEANELNCMSYVVWKHSRGCCRVTLVAGRGG